MPKKKLTKKTIVQTEAEPAIAKKLWLRSVKKFQVVSGLLGALFVLALLYTGVVATAIDNHQEHHHEGGDAAGSALATAARNASTTARGQVDMAAGPQYVVFAFDGSYSLSMWEDTRAFVREMNAAGTAFKFTYFINPIYLLTEKEAVSLYKPPRHRSGASAIGYADSVYDAQQRVGQIQKAHAEGNEIASHAVGHFDGTTWTYDEWYSELTQFDSILAYKGIDRKSMIRGFRAPELGQNENLQEVLRALGYKYDASKVGLASNTPYKKEGLWELPIASIDYAPAGTPGLSMDYSLYMHQTGAVDKVRKGTSEWQRLYDETMVTYRDYFKANYEGNHAPVYIAHHFSAWNDGVYYEVMKDFAREVCVKKNVQCVSYRELYRNLNVKY